MIELYLSIAEKLSEIPELKYIDIDGSEEIKTSPAAFIKMGRLPWEQLLEGAQVADVSFTIRLDITPYHRSAADAPANVLDNLKQSLAPINSVRDKLINEDTSLITNIVPVGEDLRKTGGKYEMMLDFKGQVHYKV